MMIFIRNVRCYCILFALLCFMLSVKLSKSFHVVKNHNGLLNRNVQPNINMDYSRMMINTSPTTTATTKSNIAGAFRLNMVNNNDNDDINVNNNIGIDVSLDSRLYKVRISRAVGIE